MDRFTGKTALVSGAGGGIGRAVASRLAGEGAAVMCVDRDAGAAAQTVAGLERAAALECDVTDAGVVRERRSPRPCAASTTLDVLVNAAGDRGVASGRGVSRSRTGAGSST